MEIGTRQQREGTSALVLCLLRLRPARPCTELGPRQVQCCCCTRLPVLVHAARVHGGGCRCLQVLLAVGRRRQRAVTQQGAAASCPRYSCTRCALTALHCNCGGAARGRVASRAPGGLQGAPCACQKLPQCDLSITRLPASPHTHQVPGDQTQAALKRALQLLCLRGWSSTDVKSAATNERRSEESLAPPPPPAASRCLARTHVRSLSHAFTVGQAPQCPRSRSQNMSCAALKKVAREAATKRPSLASSVSMPASVERVGGGGKAGGVRCRHACQEGPRPGSRAAGSSSPARKKQEAHPAGRRAPPQSQPGWPPSDPRC